jgi:hypothetical protein
MRWTEALDQQLRDGVAAKKSAREIAAEIGPPCTVRAVFNRARRTGVKFDVETWRQRCGRYDRSPEARAKTSAANTRRWADPEARRAASERMKRMFDDPAYAEAHRERICTYTRSPEGRNQRSRTSAKMHAARIGLPAAYRPLYRKMVTQYRYRAEDARALVLEQVERDREAEIARRAEEMRARAEAMRTGGGRAAICQPLAVVR